MAEIWTTRKLRSMRHRNSSQKRSKGLVLVCRVYTCTAQPTRKAVGASFWYLILNLSSGGVHASSKVEVGEMFAKVHVAVRLDHVCLEGHMSLLDDPVSCRYQCTSFCVRGAGLVLLIFVIVWMAQWPPRSTFLITGSGG